MRPWAVATLTVGLREQIALLQSVEPLIRWRWWCRGPLRLRFTERAVADAVAAIKREVGKQLSAAPGGDIPPPQALAVDLAVTLGGTPDSWRAVRWRDAVYAMRLKAWTSDPKAPRRPVWGESEGQVRVPGGNPNFQQVA